MKTAKDLRRGDWVKLASCGRKRRVESVWQCLDTVRVTFANGDCIIWPLTQIVEA